MQNHAPLFPQEYEQFVLFGDSLTQQSFLEGGTGSVLADLYQRKLDVLNRGYSGYNSRWAALVLPKIIQPSTKHIKIATIWLGANDAVLEHRAQHVDVATFKQNLKVIIDHFPKETTVLVLTPPPVELELRKADVARRFPDQTLELDRTVERTREFALACAEVVRAAKAASSSKEIALVELHDSMEEAAKSHSSDRHEALSVYLSDGLHLTRVGYQFVTQQIMNVIRSQFPHLMPDAMERRFPPWDQIDLEDPASSFG